MVFLRIFSTLLLEMVYTEQILSKRMKNSFPKINIGILTWNGSADAIDFTLGSSADGIRSSDSFVVLDFALSFSLVADEFKKSYVCKLVADGECGTGLKRPSFDECPGERIYCERHTSIKLSLNDH